jgi:hypothetical protein
MVNVPIYIKIDDYKDIVEILSITREKIAQARSVLGKISEVKAQEDEVISNWAHEIDEVDQWIEEIDKTLLHTQMQ